MSRRSKQREKYEEQREKQEEEAKEEVGVGESIGLGVKRGAKWEARVQYTHTEAAFTRQRFFMNTVTLVFVFTEEMQRL